MPEWQVPDMKLSMQVPFCQYWSAVTELSRRDTAADAGTSADCCSSKEVI